MVPLLAALRLDLRDHDLMVKTLQALAPVE